jgi:hypothetical protein
MGDSVTRCDHCGAVLTNAARARAGACPSCEFLSATARAREAVDLARDALEDTADAGRRGVAERAWRDVILEWRPLTADDLAAVFTYRKHLADRRRQQQRARVYAALLAETGKAATAERLTDLVLRALAGDDAAPV